MIGTALAFYTGIIQVLKKNKIIKAYLEFSRTTFLNV